MLLPALSNLWLSPKKHFLMLLLMVCVWRGANSAQAATAGTVLAWGDNRQGQVTGTGPPEGLSGMTAIAAGLQHTVALKTDGSVLAWGRNSEGQTTVPVAAQSGVTAIAAGGEHTVALLGGSVALRARTSGNELVLSWLTSTAGLKLQSTLDLTPPVTWTDSTNPPAVIGAQFTVTNTLSGPAQFYRLRKL